MFDFSFIFQINLGFKKENMFYIFNFMKMSLIFCLK